MIILNFIYMVLFAAVEGNDALGKLKFDPQAALDNGLLISIVGYVIVFMALLLLFLFIFYLTKFLNYKQHKKLTSDGMELEEGAELEISGEINAAIALAVYKHLEEAHDIEDTILTINRVQKIYQPWNSKIYNLTDFPRKIWK